MHNKFISNLYQFISSPFNLLLETPKQTEPKAAETVPFAINIIEVVNQNFGMFSSLSISWKSNRNVNEWVAAAELNSQEL